MDEPLQTAKADEGGYWEDRGGYRVFVPSPKATAGAAPAGSPLPADPEKPAARTDPVAVVALVMGLFGVLGLPLGLWAKARIRRSRAGGAGLANTAVFLGCVWLATALLFVVVALVGNDEEDAPPGSSTASGVALRVGQCLIEESADSDEGLLTVPCNQSHDAEVFAVFPIGSPSWPGEKVVRGKADDGCSKRFVGYVGKGAADSGDYAVRYYYPQEPSYRTGQRSISCVLVDVDGDRLIRSAKG